VGVQLDRSFRTDLRATPGRVGAKPALVLKCGYRPLSYYRCLVVLARNAVKPQYLDRWISDLRQYDDAVHSPKPPCGQSPRWLMLKRLM